MMSSDFKARLAIAVAVCLSMSGATSVAQERLARKATEIVRASSPPQLDGRLDEQVWAEATVITTLPVRAGGQGEPSESSISSGHDDDNLYIGLGFWTASRH